MTRHIPGGATRALALLTAVGALIGAATGPATALPAATSSTATANTAAANTAASAAQAAPPVSPAAPKGHPALGAGWTPTPATGAARKAGQVVPGQVLLQLAPQTTLATTRTSTGTAAPTSSAPLNAALAGLRATALHPLAGGLLIADVGTEDPAAAAARLASVPGVLRAEPNRYVGGMSSGYTPLPAAAVRAGKAATTAGRAAGTAPSPAPSLPTNYGLTSSLESWLNAGGVDAVGAYSDLTGRYGQLPGTGEIITNVSIGDLTDQSMADAGDPYVRANGATTVVSNGQRYLDLPSMPLIPTFTADASGVLNPTGSTEDQDASDGEILLDFGVMSPLPHDRQRPGATGSGVTDLLGIAPGASYRLVVPAQPTMDQVAVALLAAARQTPRPDVINASLGFGTDTTGFAGRYLEDDPTLQGVIATIVHQYGITVTVAANDGTRLYTPAAVGPDGGSTPTDVTRDPARATGINDDAASTTPSEVVDSGAIAAGGSTTDDTLATGPAGAATVAETRISGSGDFSSGFGSRIDLSAPSDNIVAMAHSGDTAQSVGVGLSGGTSAAAPEIAAAAAVVKQAARLAGRTLTPAQIRDLLEHTARRVGTAPQIDRSLQVGPQVDLTAAVESLLPGAKGQRLPRIDRLSVAHRVSVSGLGGTFVEYTDQGAIDLSGPVDGNGRATGQGLAGPVTIAADVSGAGRDARYRLTVGSTVFDSDTPSIRVTPAQLLTAAGLPLVSTAPRTVGYSFSVRQPRGGSVSVTRSLTLSASTGTVTEAAPPTVAPVVRDGQDVTVHYDLGDVRGVKSPKLVLSTVGHWNPALAALFNPAWSTALTATSGTVTIPASAFTGGGLYGVGVIQNDVVPANPVYGEFAPLRVDGFTADRRPDAPTLAAAGQPYGHTVTVTRAAPAFSLRYDVSRVHGVRGAVLEISAPAPTLFNSLNTFTAQNGTARDNDGFDSGSVVYQPLPRRAGSVRLDALALGLASSVQYNVRVLPVGGDGKPVGQASPSSALTVDDGQIPGSGSLLGFAAAGHDSVAAVTGLPHGSTTGASVRRYDTATGRYGAVVTSDATASAQYDVLGVDTTAHSVLLAHWTGDQSKTLEVWNLSTGTEIGAPVTLTASRYLLFGGRVDPTRHRAALLVWAQPGNTDQLLPLDMATGALGTAIPLDPAAGQTSGRYFTGLDLDASTGTVQVAHLGGGGFCFGFGAKQVLNVDLGSRAVTASPAGVSSCGVQFASSQNGSSSWSLTYSAFSVNFPGTAGLSGYDERTLAAAGGFRQRQENPLGLAVDGVHHLAVVAYGTPVGRVVYGQPFAEITDSNAMSQLDVVDLTTGKVLRTLSSFNFAPALTGPLSRTADRTIQLDPTTRTGWTYAPNSAQIQAFTY
ncbi:S8 family serine peptidase [Streptacidiphilus sp. EB129]|uniref:S8 family serine peptidase n=1 Tax=Streptacidiphilus sp. EB129 TaxID=3156262 RepID=UPI0035134D7E